MRKIIQELQRHCERSEAISIGNDHWGEFIAISQTGKTVLSADLKKLFKKSLEKLGPGSFVFKVGEQVVWKWRKVEK